MKTATAMAKEKALQETILIAEKLKKEGMPIEKIAHLTGLP